MSVPVKDRFLQEAKPKYVGGKKFANLNWMKLSSGVWRLRFCPPWNKEAEERSEPFLRVEQHNVFLDAEGNKRMPMCLDFIVSDKRISSLLAEKGKLTKEDFSKIRELGCPMCTVAEKLSEKADDEEDESYKKFAPSTKYFWGIVQRFESPEGEGKQKPFNKAFAWSSSPKVFNDIKGQVQARPNVFDEKKGSDFTMNATGEGQQRRYTGIAFYEEKTPLNLAKGEKIPDLDQAMIIGVKTFSEIVNLVRSNYTILVKKSGINLNNYV